MNPFRTPNEITKAKERAIEKADQLRLIAALLRLAPGPEVHDQRLNELDLSAVGTAPDWLIEEFAQKGDP